MKPFKKKKKSIKNEGKFTWQDPKQKKVLTELEQRVKSNKTKLKS